MSRSLTAGTAGLTALFIAFLLPAPAHGQQPLASGQLRLLGVQLVVSPASQTVPKNQATKSRLLGCYVVRLLGGAR